MGNFYGYNRVSTKEQNLDRGNATIDEYCKRNQIKLEKIFSDKQTGRNFDRPRYIVLKEDVLRQGDTLIISELDRLGRNKKAIINELLYFKENGIRVLVLDLPTTLLDVSNMTDELAKLMIETINNMVIEIYASFAQAEIEKKDRRRKEGIEAMKLRGDWDKYGRPRKMSLEEFKKEYDKVLKKEIKPFQLIKKLNLKQQTYYRYIKELSKNEIIEEATEV